jgi:hypothetical protein
MKYWEIIADNLKKRGWSWGCLSAVDSEGLTIWVAGLALSEATLLIPETQSSFHPHAQHNACRRCDARPKALALSSFVVRTISRKRFALCFLK